jgi:hypothetical protein
MKKIFLFIFLIFFSFFVAKACNSSSESSKAVHTVMSKVARLLEARYQFRTVGTVEFGYKGNYSLIGLYFAKVNPMSKEEGREIIVDCVNTLLNAINSDPQIQPFLKKIPFTASDIKIKIFIFTAEGKDVFYPEIQVFSATNGKIYYSTNAPNHNGYYTEESETFEEAVKIVEESQNKGSNPLP